MKTRHFDHIDLRVKNVARKAGAKHVAGPEPYSPDDPSYYAVFFEDPEGNKLEVCYREPA